MKPDSPLSFLLYDKPDDPVRCRRLNSLACEHEIELVANLCFSLSFGCYGDVVFLRGCLEVDLVKMGFDRVKAGFECDLLPLDVFIFGPY